MKTNTHPTYYTDAVTICANCGHTFQIGGTEKELKIEICSQCHPFFTGKKVLIDTEGRVDKFRQKFENATGRKKKERAKKTLEERVNTEIAAQLTKEKAKEEKAKAARVAKRKNKED